MREPVVAHRHTTPLFDRSATLRARYRHELKQIGLLRLLRDHSRLGRCNVYGGEADVSQPTIYAEMFEMTQSRHKESVPSNYANWTVARRTMIRSPSSRYLNSSLYSLWTSHMSTVRPLTSRSQTRTCPSFKPVSRSR